MLSCDLLDAAGTAVTMAVRLLPVFCLVLLSPQCWGYPAGLEEEEILRSSALLLAAQEESPYGSLWPLPQAVQQSGDIFYIPPAEFSIVHGADSTAGPLCLVLQDAFRR